MNKVKVSGELQRNLAELPLPSAESFAEIPAYTELPLPKRIISSDVKPACDAGYCTTENSIKWCIFFLATFGGHRNRYPIVSEKRVLLESAPVPFIVLWRTEICRILYDIICG
jgi:hypothetical protein